MTLVAGIFVGGASRRMGGRPKGWLPAPEPDGGGGHVSVLERTVSLARSCCAEVVLVGRAEAYAKLQLPVVADATTADGGVAEGPLAGLVALLEHVGSGGAIVLACDMPYLTAAMLARLAGFAPEAPAVAPRDPEGLVWSPLFARYDAVRVAPVARAKLERGERSLRAVLDAVETRELPLSPEERLALRDWDTPGDVDDPRTRP